MGVLDKCYRFRDSDSHSYKGGEGMSMDVRTLVVSRQRHADNFEDGQVVFDGDGIQVVVMQWNDKGRKTFEVYVHGARIGSTSNYPKAIGMGIVSKYGKEVSHESL